MITDYISIKLVGLIAGWVCAGSVVILTIVYLYIKYSAGEDE